MTIMFILKRLGFFVIDNWRAVVVTLAVLAITLVIASKACNRQPKLDEQQIQRAQKAIADHDRKEMIEVLTESAVAERNIDANLANSDRERLKAFDDARRRASSMTNDELAAELERGIAK